MSGILCDSLSIHVDLKIVAGGQCTTYLIPSKLMFFSKLLFATVITANGKNNQKSFPVQYSPTKQAQGKALTSFPPSPLTEEQKEHLLTNQIYTMHRMGILN